jgi:hypothetical protein
MKLLLILILMISVAAASNYIDNGDFEQALSVGWTQTATGGGTTINRGTTYHPDNDYEVYLYKATGTTGHAQLWQIAEVPTCNMDFSFSAKLYAWDNYSGAWGGAAVVIGYLDNSNTLLGETMVCQYTVDCPWTNAPDRHVIQVADSLWHDYSFNLLDELFNVPAVDPDDVAKIQVTLNAEVVHC